ncbi:hypothetical protein [Bradyrhizobium sp. HKCCYLS20291]|uniref:hypothetical protein n=1 Tax=Bradyrhizobium sp. HKCCYLS20291 TaxID=3420766 RepID=UPI003EB7ABF6
MTVKFWKASRNLVMGAVLACALINAASSQQSGTVLRASSTLLGGTTATIEIDIAGPKTANTETNLLLEFGPDGNSRTNPVPDPALPATTTFTVSSSSGGSHVFPLFGGFESQAFPGKNVAFNLLDPPTSPGLYSLSIVHLQEVPAGVTEIWKVQINGLPRAGVRTIASVRQGAFRSLVPTGVSQGPPAITIVPPPVTVGSAPALTVRSSGGLDLSNVALSQVAITPELGISGLGIGNATPNSIVVSFNVANCTPGGERTLTIRDQNVAASAIFALAAVRQTPAISVSPTRVVIASTATLNVMSTGCFDLSGVRPSQVSIVPSTGISGITVAATSATSLSLSFAVAGDAPLVSRRLVIENGDSNSSAAFEVAAPFHPPPPPIHHCTPSQRCCEEDENGSCTLCINRPRQCP